MVTRPLPPVVLLASMAICLRAGMICVRAASCHQNHHTLRSIVPTHAGSMLHPVGSNNHGTALNGPAAVRRRATASQHHQIRKTAKRRK